MKKSILKFISITTVSICILLSSLDINAKGYNGAKEPLKKYNSEELIYLREEAIEVPIKFDNNKDQFRGAWVSTVFNLDFPKKKDMSEKEYKAEYIKMLDNLEKLNMNAIIFQVRAKSDALYNSNINPWSEYLTGKQGKSPNWDPLPWMIEETHKRGMEFHAWFNPYRVTTGGESLTSLSDKNWAKKNPSKTFTFENKIYLNPGEAETIKHINNTVMEVVEKYNVDAIHFDDYFYPSRRGDDINKFFSEEERNTFNKYGKSFKDVASWRRNNVDQLVSTVSNSIEKYNVKNRKQIQFGISPSGIWGHESNHPKGSVEGQGSKTPASSTASYDNQFADTRKWVKNGWLDYIAPQIYWTFDTKAAPYGEIADWWSETVKDTDVSLYIGHASYKKADKNNSDMSWKNPEEILNQLKFNSLYDEIKGSIFFRYESLLENTNNSSSNNEFIKILKKDYFNKKVRIPISPKKTNEKVEDKFSRKPVLVKPLKFIKK